MPISEVLAELAAERGWNDTELLACVLATLDKAEKNGELGGCLATMLMTDADEAETAVL